VEDRAADPVADQSNPQACVLHAAFLSRSRVIEGLWLPHQHIGLYRGKDDSQEFPIDAEVYVGMLLSLMAPWSYVSCRLDRYRLMITCPDSWANGDAERRVFNTGRRWNSSEDG